VLVPEQVRRVPGSARGDRRPDPEIDQTHAPVVADDHVVGVERQMEHAAVVRLGERAEGGRADPNGLGR